MPPRPPTFASGAISADMLSTETRPVTQSSPQIAEDDKKTTIADLPYGQSDQAFFCCAIAQFCLRIYDWHLIP